MNILHVYKDYYPVLGGIENHIRVLAEAQTAQGHRVAVLVCNPDARTVETELNGVRVLKVGRLATVASTPLSFELARALRRERPDITHLHVPYPVGEVSQWLAGRGRRCVVTYHADVTRPAQRLVMRLYAPLFRRILGRAVFVLATSRNYARSSPYLRPLGDKVQIVPLGVDADCFAPPASPSARQAEQILLFVGLLRHYKGVDGLIKAMPSVIASAKLVVAGDGPLRAEWEALAASLGLGARVTFLGRVPDEALPDLYRAADVYVLPATSRAEAFGVALLEAQASGVPCVTTEVGSGTSYVVEHGVTGFVVPPHSPEALARAINHLLADAGLRARLGAAARRRVLEHFTVETMLRRVDEIYARALAA